MFLDSPPILKQYCSIWEQVNYCIWTLYLWALTVSMDSKASFCPQMMLPDFHTLSPLKNIDLLLTWLNLWSLLLKTNAKRYNLSGLMKVINLLDLLTFINFSRISLSLSKQLVIKILSQTNMNIAIVLSKIWYNSICT